MPNQLMNSFIAQIYCASRQMGKSHIIQGIPKLQLNAMYGRSGIPRYTLIELACRNIHRQISEDVCYICNESKNRPIDDTLVFNNVIRDDIKEETTFLDEDYYIIRERTYDNQINDRNFSIERFTCDMSNLHIVYAHHGYQSMHGFSTVLINEDLIRRKTCQC